MISPLALDIAHLFAGGLVLASLMLLYQDRMTGLINTFALHALVVSLSVAWQAFIQQAPHLYITAAIALVIKAVVIPVALRRMVMRLGIHRGQDPLDDRIAIEGRSCSRNRDRHDVLPPAIDVAVEPDAGLSSQSTLSDHLLLDRRRS